MTPRLGVKGGRSPRRVSPRPTGQSGFPVSRPGGAGARKLRRDRDLGSSPSRSGVSRLPALTVRPFHAIMQMEGIGRQEAWRAWEWITTSFATARSSRAARRTRTGSSTRPARVRRVSAAAGRATSTGASTAIRSPARTWPWPRRPSPLWRNRRIRRCSL